MAHQVERDQAGWAERERLTCRSCGCNEATLVRQPHMNSAQWQQLKEGFLLKHPESPEQVSRRRGIMSNKTLGHTPQAARRRLFYFKKQRLGGRCFLTPC
jgi:hypothetical protein